MKNKHWDSFIMALAALVIAGTIFYLMNSDTWGLC